MSGVRYIKADHRLGLKFDASIQPELLSGTFVDEQLQFIADVVRALEQSPDFSNVRITERVEKEVSR